MRIRRGCHGQNRTTPLALPEEFRCASRGNHQGMPKGDAVPDHLRRHRRGTAVSPSHARPVSAHRRAEGDAELKVV